MQTQNTVVEALLKAETYPEKTSKVDLIQTHISFVFITDNLVYKVKKAVNFGFLDFSTLEKRRVFCEKELELNRRLCPDIYLEVVPINKAESIKIKGDGETVEYALKMKRLPQERIMTTLIKQNKVTKQIVDEIAHIVSQFHSKAQTNPTINEFGSLKIVKTNWDENFSQTQKYINQTITQEQYCFLQNQINRFMENNQPLFEDRITHNFVRDCHGDLHSGNIFITEKICIFDAIEFNDRFRYSDVASDVAFLAMDLDYQQRPDLATHFIQRYIEYSKDHKLKQLLPFYKCYRAYVRGKVISFKLDDPNITKQEKESAIQEAQAYFKLATDYAKNL
ncbi:MAG: phosphotransferase [Candidatus Bathyarchaeota archaeon]|nr:phosphotransferase [Candidatus Bathyarchaeota archaeon]